MSICSLVSNNNEVLFCNNFCLSAAVLSSCLTVTQQECTILGVDLRAIFEIIRGFWILFLSFFGFAYGSNVLADWVVPEKKISVAKGLSKETHQIVSSLGSPLLDTRRALPPGDLRQNLLRFAEQTMMQYQNVTLETHESLFDVEIEAIEIAGVRAFRIRPSRIAESLEGRIFLHAHGGGHFMGGGVMATREGAMIAASSGIEVVSVDYTLSTVSPFPAALNDLVTVYQELLGSLPAELIAVGGSSAGGNLTLAMVLRLKELSESLPGALFVGTPNADLLYTGDTIITNEYVDNTLPTVEGVIRAAAKLYAGDFDLKNPLISPLYGEYEGFPPTYLVSGTRDLLLSDTVKVHRKLRDAGAVADLNVFEGIPHGAYLAAPGSSEFEAALGDLKKFLEAHLRE